MSGPPDTPGTGRRPLALLAGGRNRGWAEKVYPNLAYLAEKGKPLLTLVE